MNTRHLFLFLASSALAMGGLWTACSGVEPNDSAAPDDAVAVESIQQSLEKENGGLAMEDDTTRFGRSDLDETDVEADSAASSLPMTEETDVEEYTGEVASTDVSRNRCPNGRLAGTWRELDKDHGIFYGKWANDLGKVDGHLKGFYGRDLRGYGVFFGKYIDLNGRFKGLIKGRYGNGFYKGRWYDRNGLRGVLSGVYGNHVFRGTWRAFCSTCHVECRPGFVPDPEGKCFCIPDKSIPCRLGRCPDGMICDPCPAWCPPHVFCPAVCAPPICVPRPTIPPPRCKTPCVAGVVPPDSTCSCPPLPPPPPPCRICDAQIASLDKTCCVPPPPPPRCIPCDPNVAAPSNVICCLPKPPPPTDPIPCPAAGCPDGTTCDRCPSPCPAGAFCIAACGQPVCKPIGPGTNK